MRNVFLFCVLIFLLSCQSEPNSSLPEGFRLEEGFQIELVAMEPLIADPVDMEIDEWGRMFVVEMHGYPLELSGTGLVKRLVDTDGDGLPDESTIFADSLIVPTGIMRWKQGFIVTDPPHVYYFEDLDDDGKADIREVLLTGFARSNPQHNVNNPTYGLDNWIYLSHEGAVRTQLFGDLLGDKGTEVHMPQVPNGERLPQNANGLGVRFRPDSGQLEMLSAKSQYGQAFDEWGHHFQTNNASHLYHKVISAPYMQRNRDLLIPSSRFFTPKGGRGFDIFPITANPDHQLLTDIGALTSACGIMSYSGALFPEQYHQSIFAAEPVHNLIHVDRLEENGATFHSVPLLEGREFLASTDAWFRPVNHYIGPDGSVFVLDYYRKIIEHPEWLSDEVIQSGDLYVGMDQGRIYRISPEGTDAMSFLDRLTLGDANLETLVSHLANPNIWWRTHAQRLLMDRLDPDVSSALKEFVRSTDSSVGKVHALWLLEAKDQMEEEILLRMLDDAEAGVRENAIKIVERYQVSSVPLSNKLLEMVADKHAKVRFQLLLTLGNRSDAQSFEVRNRLLFEDIEDPWIHYAALSAVDFDATSLFSQVASKLDGQQTEGTKAFFKKLSQLIARSGSGRELNRFLSEILQSSPTPWFAPLVLEGIANGVNRDRDLSLSSQNVRLLSSNFSAGTDAALRHQSLALLKAVGFFQRAKNPLLSQAIDIVQQQDYAESLLSDAVQIIGWSGSDNHFALLQDLFATNGTPEIRSLIMRAMNEMSNDLATQFMVSEWSALMPAERRNGVQIFFDTDQNKLILMKAIAEGSIQPSVLSWGQTVSLLNNRDQAIRSLARVHLQGNELNADTVWLAFQECLGIDGQVDHGQEVFRKYCGVCHQKAGNLGVAFGPDLAAVQNRNKTALLVDILQPNKSIADGFELWTISLASGNSLSGIISQQSPTSLTIRDATGQETTIDRNDVKELKASEWSAMPENLQAQINQQEMADLLAFLKST
ncbi:MAG: c-type cytochrome [Saprospiraceae bacterium]|nr:c-type cytochrome [Saprospiraceae bacterium]